jgi:hypothetical protein
MKVAKNYQISRPGWYAKLKELPIPGVGWYVSKADTRPTLVIMTGIIKHAAHGSGLMEDSVAYIK